MTTTTIDSDIRRLLEPVPAEEAGIAEMIVSQLQPEEQVLIRVFSDLAPDFSFAAQWVAVTDRRVLIAGDGGASTGNGLTAIDLDDLIAARAEALVGGGRLELDRKSGPALHVPYSSSLAVKFSEVARGLEQLRKGEPLLINTERDRLRCDKCGRLLPEKNGLCPACVKRLRTLGRIVAYMRPHKWRAAVLAVSSVATTLAELAPPLITRRLVDEVLLPVEEAITTLDERFVLLGWLVLMLVGVRVLSWIAELAHGWVVTWLSARVTADIRAELYRRLEMLSLQFYDKRQVGGLISRITRDAGTLQEFLIDGLPYLVINALMIVGILAFMFSMSWQVTLYILIPVPLLLVWSVLFWRRMRRLFHKYGQGWSLLGTQLNEAFHGIRVVKAFSQEHREIGAFEEKNEQLARVSRRTARNWWVLWAMMGLMSAFGMFIIWLAGGMQVLDGVITTGTLLALYSYMWLVYGPLEWFAEVNSWMTRHRRPTRTRMPCPCRTCRRGSCSRRSPSDTTRANRCCTISPSTWRRGR